MGYLKDLVNINGVMVAFIKVILSKVFEAGMVCGVLRMINIVKAIKVIIKWIRSLVMEFISGKMVGYIKEILKMIIEMVLDNFSMDKIVYIKVIGSMDNNLKINNLNFQKLHALQQVFK
jgi:hypothetical protein